jgi:LmbE family N-acetylglucosaminyl deacetylase
MKNIFRFVFILFATLFIWVYANSQVKLKDYWEYPREYDYPVNVIHGTYDFDEWPGVDHPVVYKSDFAFNKSKNDRYKIDYKASNFDKDDHEGYLKSSSELTKRGINNLEKYFDEKLTGKKDIVVLAVFAHPDDEVLLAGGFFSWAKRKGYKTNLVVISNGAASIKPLNEKDMKEKKLNPNAFGVTGDGKEITEYDEAAADRVNNLNYYGKRFLKLDNIEILKMNEKIKSNTVTGFGEVANMDYTQTYGAKSRYRQILLSRMLDLLNAYNPDIVLTHGSNGEYGHYLHIVTNIVVNQAMDLSEFRQSAVFLTCMPEYNIDDKITHFLELDEKTTLSDKWKAVISIPEIYQSGKDFDKPWDPYKYPNGSFVKDYGYHPTEAKPPKYEFFKVSGY